MRAGAVETQFDCADPLTLACQRGAAHPRSALSADGNTLWLAAVDGWQSGSIGLTAAELAGFLRERGAHMAMALDGGSSSTPWRSMARLLSSPSDGVERPVANHLAIKYGMLPAGQLVGLICEDSVFNCTPPRPGAQVTLDDGRVRTTAADGFYDFANVTPRLACVTVRKAGYRTKTQCQTVDSGIQTYNSVVLEPGTDPPPDAGVPDASVPDDAGASTAVVGSAPMRDSPTFRRARAAATAGRDRPADRARGAGRMDADASSRYKGSSVSQIHTQLLTDDASGVLVERSFRLRVVSGPDQGKEHALDEGTTMVGTHADNDLVLTDATVSRYHLEIRVRRDGIEVRDLDTTNGTKHGGARVGSVVLSGAARLRLGKHTEMDVEPVDTSVDLDDVAAAIASATCSARPRRCAAVRAAREGRADRGHDPAPGRDRHRQGGDRRGGPPRRAAAADGPFVVVDCGSIPHELIASELFGHAKGSFTGAGADKQGLIEAANHGTLFLDEIGELALDLQPQLLRVLDRRQVRRVGETQSVDVDIRVIAATHRDLRAMVKAGQFREDLYYRLAVVATHVPPLRERKADIPALATWFADKMGRGGFAQSPALLEQLERHDWPGNVRELRNVVERALSLGDAALAGPRRRRGRARRRQQRRR